MQHVLYLVSGIVYCKHGYMIYSRFVTNTPPFTSLLRAWHCVQCTEVYIGLFSLSPVNTHCLSFPNHLLIQSICHLSIKAAVLTKENKNEWESIFYENISSFPVSSLFSVFWLNTACKFSVGFHFSTQWALLLCICKNKHFIDFNICALMLWTRAFTYECLPITFVEKTEHVFFIERASRAKG